MVSSKEHVAYQQLEILKRSPQVIPAEALLSHRSAYFALCRKVYGLSHELYQKIPLRKNGEPAFVHPTNVAYFLKKAGCSDLVIIAGLLHDYLEESLDVYGKDGLSPLSVQLGKNFAKLQPVLQLLTRNKEDSYYKYISKIFLEKNPKVKEAAINVKLADRIHNVLSIDTFNKQQRIYQCFKNIFILNNVKKYLLEVYGERMWNGRINNPTEFLFNKCTKATFDAFIHIYNDPAEPGTEGTHTMLQLAFKKFLYLYSGLNVVTDIEQGEPHLVQLYQGIVRKYDALLHREIKEFQQRQTKELLFCKKFFKDYRFNDRQLQVIIDYKDAYAFKEMLAKLLYKPDYFMSLFIASQLQEHRIPE